MVIAPDADLDLAVEAALFSGYGTAGQRCTSLGTVIAHEEVHDEFLRRFTEAVRDAPVGDPASSAVVYGPLLDEKFAHSYETALSWIDAHHTVLGSSAVGRITAESPRAGFVGDPSDGLYYHPVLVAGVRPTDKIFLEETFGPLVGVTTYRTLDEAIELANAPGYGLSAAVWTRDPVTAFRFRQGIGAGMVSVNNSTSGAEAHLPFGGNGKSGNGSRQSGVWVLDQFTRWQSVNWDFSGTLQKAQMDVTTVESDLDYRLLLLPGPTKPEKAFGADGGDRDHLRRRHGGTGPVQDRWSAQVRWTTVLAWPIVQSGKAARARSASFPVRRNTWSTWILTGPERSTVTVWPSKRPTTSTTASPPAKGLPPTERPGPVTVTLTSSARFAPMAIRTGAVGPAVSKETVPSGTDTFRAASPPSRTRSPVSCATWSTMPSFCGVR